MYFLNVCVCDEAVDPEECYGKYLSFFYIIYFSHFM